MRTVYKYPIRRGKIVLPQTAQIVKVGIDYNNEECIWAIVDPTEQETNERCFVIAATGELWDENQVKYIGTYFDGGCVWHVLEIIDWERKKEIYL